MKKIGILKNGFSKEEALKALDDIITHFISKNYLNLAEALKDIKNNIKDENFNEYNLNILKSIEILLIPNFNLVKTNGNLQNYIWSKL